MSPAPPGGPRPVSVVAAAAVLLLVNLGVNLALRTAVNTSGVLSGEETSVSFRDPALLPARFQHNPMATNFGGHLYYYLASYVITPLDLLFGRTAKAFGMATMAPLVFLVALSMLKFALPVSIGLGLLAAFVPGILSFSWMATEYGLECPFALLALLLASRQAKAAAVAAVVLVALSTIVFAPGICFLPVVFYLVYNQHLRRPKKPWVLLAILPFLAMLVIVCPALWWTNSNQILTGGGSLSSPAKAWENLLQMLTECGLHGGSYYYPSEYAALSSPALWGSALIGMALSLWKRKGLWLWIGLVVAVSVYVSSGSFIGMRRGVPIVVFSILFAGLFWTVLSEAAGWVGRAVALGLIGVCVIWAGIQANDVRGQYASGMRAIQIDFRIALPPDKNMAEAFELLLERPEVLEQNRQSFEPDRTLAVLHVLAARNGRDSSKYYTRELLLQTIEEHRAAQRAARQPASRPDGGA